jgi:hypothetical protein
MTAVNPSAPAEPPPLAHAARMPAFTNVCVGAEEQRYEGSE